MGDKTAIAWTDATFNPWIGCTEVSTAESGGGGCDDCYARALDARHKWGGATHWGAGVPRMRTSAANWRKPILWNARAFYECSECDWRGESEGSGCPQCAAEIQTTRRRVFCASLADVFDNEVAPQWRAELFNLIDLTPRLTWLLLTKRVGNARAMIREAVLSDQRPWPWPNVWLGATIVNQMEANRDVPKLLAIPAAVRFVSYEPALGPVDWTTFPGIDWIIVGGASRQRKAAPEFDLELARNTVRHCRQIGAAPFVKQLGSNPQEIADPAGVTDSEKARWHADGWTQIWEPIGGENFRAHWRKYLRLKDRAGADPAEWPADLRVREFPV